MLHTCAQDCEEMRANMVGSCRGGQVYSELLIYITHEVFAITQYLSILLEEICGCLIIVPEKSKENLVLLFNSTRK